MPTQGLPFQKKELEINVHNPSKLPTINYHKLSILQGDLKTLSEKNKAMLCKSILEHGYFIPAFIWKAGEAMYILDATQRYHALQELEKQGYTIPDIPYIEIEAKDKKDAAQKLLQITSRYGEINPETSFFEDFDIAIDYVNTIAIPELKIAFDHDARFKKGKGNIAQDISFIENEEDALKVHHQELFENVEDILIDFSGGKDSSFSLLWAKTNFPDKHIIASFSNTNVEFPGMASHVVDCCKCLEVDYNILYPHEDMWLKIKEKGWPTGVFPWCQTYFIHKLVDKEHKRFDPEKCIILDGSAAKQASRLSTKTKTSGVKALEKYQFYHPAFDVSRDVIDTILEKSEIPIWEGYDMGFVRTACWMCPNQCGEQAYALNENYPGLVNVIRRWEEKIGKPIRYMNNQSIDDIIEIGRKKKAKSV